MKPFCLFIFAVSTLRFTGAFLPLTASPLLRSAGISSNSQTAVSVSRRDVGETVALSTFLTVVSTFSFLEQASASGGATAGGVYLLSVRSSSKSLACVIPMSA